MGKEGRHTGVVVKMGDALAQVVVEDSEGKRYRWCFENEFLKACGVTAEGNEVEIVFQTTGDSPSGVRVAKIGDVSTFTEGELAELSRRVGQVDVAAAFGSHMPPE